MQVALVALNPYFIPRQVASGGFQCHLPIC